MSNIKVYNLGRSRKFQKRGAGLGNKEQSVRWTRTEYISVGGVLELMGDAKETWKVKTLDEILLEKKRRRELEEKTDCKRPKNLSTGAGGDPYGKGSAVQQSYLTDKATMFVAA
ncbi:hypothetical protein AALO_G00047330 [Alosa alosa]|uniref:Uncharacterized protein n=1 Tax=Alosa alosa TaxID=278164 RepID=A0AAV6H3E4_9TELE|nr:hypothetical protein AALO_G00047330 [Alosa alosa]